MPMVVSRRSFPLVPGFTTSTGSWLGNIRGRNTMASMTMNTTPAKREYRSSFVACGGGLRLRLKGTSGFEGRAIFTRSLHVNRRPTGHGAVRLLHGIPSLRVIRAEDIDGRTEFRSKEPGVLAKHRELLDGTNANRFIRFRVAELLAEALGVRRHVLRPIPHPWLREGPLHEDVHRDGSVLRKGTRDLVDANFPRRSGVQRDPFRLDSGDLQDLSDVSEGRLQQSFSGFCLRVDFSWDGLGIRRLDDESIASDSMPDLFASMGCKRSEEFRLDLHEPTGDLRSGPALRSTNVPRPSGLQVEVPVAERGLVVHRLHRSAGRLDRATQDAQEPRIDSPPFLPRGMARRREPDPVRDPSSGGRGEVQVDVRIVEPVPGVRDRHVVLDEILSGVPQVDRVPVQELAAQVLDHRRLHAEAARDGLRGPLAEEDVVEEGVVEAL